MPSGQEDKSASTDRKEESMRNFVRGHKRVFMCVAFITAAIFLAGAVGWAWPASTRSGQETPKAPDDASLLEGFRHVEVASVSDAIEQLSARKMYMTHRMRPIFPTKFAGFALTVLLKKETNHDPNALSGML